MNAATIVDLIRNVRILATSVPRVAPKAIPTTAFLEPQEGLCSAISSSLDWEPRLSVDWLDGTRGRKWTRLIKGQATSRSNGRDIEKSSV